jgi:hypothetical protein
MKFWYVLTRTKTFGQPAIDRNLFDGSAPRQKLVCDDPEAYDTHMNAGALSEPMKERWRTAGQFADVLDAEVKSRQHPFVARVVSWFNLCRVCQDFEEQMLLAEAPPPDEQQLHAALLSTAIASGDRLLLECQNEESLRPLNLTLDALRAKLESLRITYEQWHTEINPQRQAAVLKEVFGGAI